MRSSLEIVLLYCSCAAVGCGRVPTVDEIRPKASNAAQLTDEVTAQPGDWPWWRGPRGDATANGQAPIEWGVEKNVRWRVDVPGRGHSSPIVCGERIFLTTADRQAEEQRILGYDRSTGERLWSTVAHTGGFMKKHQKNSFASATPAWDGERVFAAFINGGGLYVTATNAEGKILWQTKAGPFQSEHGYGSSPVLYKSLVILCGDNMAGSYIVALDRTSGQIAWRTARKRPGIHGSYATPIICQCGGKPQVILVGHGKVCSYDPATGRLLWHCDGPCEVAACTPAVAGDMVLASGGYPEKELLAIRADGKGDVTDSKIMWRSHQGVTYVPSPLVHDGALYIVADNGIVTCYDLATGKLVWKNRLPGSFSASPVLAEGNFYVPNESGTTFVFRANPEFEVLAKNDLADSGFASPVICDGRIYLRTNHHLYCIDAVEPELAARR